MVVLPYHSRGGNDPMAIIKLNEDSDYLLDVTYPKDPGYISQAIILSCSNLDQSENILILKQGDNISTKITLSAKVLDCICEAWNDHKAQKAQAENEEDKEEQ